VDNLRAAIKEIRENPINGIEDDMLWVIDELLKRVEKLERQVSRRNALRPIMPEGCGPS